MPEKEGPDIQSYGVVTMPDQVKRTKQKQKQTKATTKQTTQKQARHNGKVVF
jgi:starvation-inducible outer membrane lipoprotein